MTSVMSVETPISHHRRLRRFIMKPLTPSALKSLQERVTVEADELVQRLVSQGSFCAT